MVYNSEKEQKKKQPNSNVEHVVHIGKYFNENIFILIE